MKTNMTIKTFLLSALLLCGSQAIAQSIPMTKTFEVSASSVRMPATVSGTISLRECDECDFHSLRVTPQTGYQINGKGYRLEEFKRMLITMKLQAEVFVNVKRDDASNTVASVFIYSDQ